MQLKKLRSFVIAKKYFFRLLIILLVVSSALNLYLSHKIEKNLDSLGSLVCSESFKIDELQKKIKSISFNIDEEIDPKLRDFSTEIQISRDRVDRIRRDVDFIILQRGFR